MSGCVWEDFLDEINIWVRQLSQQILSPDWVGLLNQVKDWLEQKDDPRFSCPTLGHQLFLVPRQSAGFGITLGHCCADFGLARSQNCMIHFLLIKVHIYIPVYIYVTNMKYFHSLWQIYSHVLLSICTFWFCDTLFGKLYGFCPQVLGDGAHGAGVCGSNRCQAQCRGRTRPLLVVGSSWCHHQGVERTVEGCSGDHCQLLGDPELIPTAGPLCVNHHPRKR